MTLATSEAYNHMRKQLSTTQIPLQCTETPVSIRMGSSCFHSKNVLIANIGQSNPDNNCDGIWSILYAIRKKKSIELTVQGHDTITDRCALTLVVKYLNF